MELSQLVAYAEAKYNAIEEYQWDNFSVLRNPVTNEWVAILMQQRDINNGIIVEHCDIKCGRELPYAFSIPYISLPYRMHGKQWLGVKINGDTDARIVFQMFDRAMGVPYESKHTIILKSNELPKKPNYVEIILQKYATISPQKAPQIKDCHKCSDVVFQQKHENSHIQTKSNKNYETTPIQNEKTDYFQHGATIILKSEEPPKKENYTETIIPPRYATNQTSLDKYIFKKTQKVTVQKLRQRVLYVLSYIPPKIRKMTDLCGHSGSFEQKCKNFYTQAKFMENYEDNQAYNGDFHQYFPTYNDLTLEQLRGYFTWRTEIRKGNFQPISTSLAYIYVYELLNGVGTNSPENVLQKLKKFETGYLDSGIGDIRMKANIRRWMEEFAVINTIHPEIAQRYFNKNKTMQDRALVILNQPHNHNDTEVFEALCTMTTLRLDRSPVITNHRVKAKQLFADLWRHMFKRISSKNSNFFNICFGTQRNIYWHPLSNAIYWQSKTCKDTEYVLNEIRRYICKNGIWYERAYHKSYFNDKLFNGFLHEADRLFRIHLQTGHALKENKDEAWATPYINEVIKADGQTTVAHSKPEISNQFSKSEQMRHDSSVVCDRLVTDNKPENIKTKSWKSPYFHAKLERAKPKINIQVSKLEQIRRDSAAIYESLLINDETENTKEKIINPESRENKSWGPPYFHAMMKAKRQTETDHARPKINIQFSKLEQIRNDASETCNSLLTDDEPENIGKKEKTINPESRENKSWEPPYFHAMIKAEQAKPKVNIQFSKLEKIRSDASEICDSLLTEEELWETKTDEKAVESKPKTKKTANELLTEIQLKILRMMLRKEDIHPVIAKLHLMPSVVADEINEALFEKIGDMVLESDGNKLSIIEDYKEDLNELFGG